MDTRQLRSFLKIAELRSISRAADALGIAQPSLSQQLLRLEDEVGFKLFRRSARGVELTEAGRVFQEHSWQILHATEQALSDVQQLGAVASGEVVLALPHTLSKLIGVALFEAVTQHAPQISLRLVEAFSSNIRAGLEAGVIDIGLLNDRGSMRHLSARKLVSEELFLVGPPGVFGASAAEAPVIQPGDIRDFPLITPGDQHDLRSFLDREAARLGFSYRLAMEVDAVGLVIELISRGHGYAILPLPAVAEGLVAGSVTVARLGDGSLRRTLCMVRNRAKVVTHASVYVEDQVVRIISELIAAGEWNARLHSEADD